MLAYISFAAAALLIAIGGSPTAAASVPRLIADIGDNAYATEKGNALAGVDPFYTHNGIVYWVEYSTASGLCLWCSDGGATPTLLLQRFRGKLLQFDALGNGVYFALDLRLGRVEGEENKVWLQLWRTEGTVASTRKVLELDVPDTAPLGDITGVAANTGIKTVSVDGRLYICAGWTHIKPGSSGYNISWAAGTDELWRYDGDGADPVKLVDFEEQGISPFCTFVHLNGYGYTVALMPDVGNELIRVNLRDPNGGVELVKEICPGAGSGSIEFAFARVIDGSIYFVASDRTRGLELWRSDGTEAGTGMVTDLRPGSGSGFPRELIAFQDRIYFKGNDGAHDRELFSMSRRGDDVRIAPESVPDGSIRGLSAHGDYLYFTCNTDAHGRELWRFDGRTASLFHEFIPGPEGITSTYTNGPNAISVGDEWFFSAEEYGLWYLAPGANDLVRLGDMEVFSRGGASMHASDGTMFFGGYTPETGIEMYAVAVQARNGNWMSTESLHGRIRNDVNNTHKMIGGDDPSAVIPRQHGLSPAVASIDALNWSAAGKCGVRIGLDRGTNARVNAWTLLGRKAHSWTVTLGAGEQDLFVPDTKSHAAGTMLWRMSTGKERSVVRTVGR